MKFVFGVPVALFLITLVIGGLTGRVRLTSCCTVADPRKDLRMASAFQEEALQAEARATYISNREGSGGAVGRA